MPDEPWNAADAIPPSEDDGVETSPGRWQRTQPWIAALVLIVASGNLIRVPFYSLGPGPATDVLELVEVDGIETYPSAGDLLLTTASISSGSLTVFEYLWTLADPNLETIPADRIVPPGTSDEEQDAENLRAMEASKLEAEHAAYQALGYERIQAVKILSVLPDGASAEVLKPGDLILDFDGIRLKGPGKLVRAIGEHAPGDTVEARLIRKGRLKDVTLTIGEVEGQPRLGVTLLPAYRPSVEVHIDTQRIGGPSGGLVFALALVELLDEEDLIRDRTIAVTGTIQLVDGIGVVGPIGGIGEKIRGAAAVGAELFIVPKQHEAEALALAPDGLRVVGVSTLLEAIEALRAN